MFEILILYVQTGSDQNTLIRPDVDPDPQPWLEYNQNNEAWSLRRQCGLQREGGGRVHLPRDGARYK